MRLLTKFLIVLAIVSVFATGPVSAWAKPVKGLFLYWRTETDCSRGFKAAMKELGYEIEATEFVAREDVKRLEEYLDTVDESKFDFIYVITTKGAMTAAARFKKIPIIFGMVTTPVKAGLIRSWESSGNNVTGITHAIPITDEFNIMVKLGNFKKIGMLYDPSLKNTVFARDELSTLFRERDTALAAYPVSTVEEIEAAVKKLIEEKVDLVYLPSDTLVLYNGDKIVKPLTENKIPTFSTLERMLNEHKAMIGVIARYTTVGQEMAANADAVLKGKAPSDVPSRRLSAEQQNHCHQFHNRRSRWIRYSL